MTRPVQIPAKRDAPWVVLKPNPLAALRLFCFPYAGGRALGFRHWPAALPPHVEVCGIELPGRGHRIRQPAPTRVEQAVAELGPAVAAAVDRPFVFFGHSLGAVLAFETAQWLERHQHRGPAQLFVSGRRAPHIPDTDPPLHKMSDADLAASLRDLNGTPPEVLAMPEMLEFLLPVLRADFEAGETYQYGGGAPLPCPITAFGGQEDEETADGKLAAWRLHTGAAFTPRTLPGGHFFIQSSEDALLAFLRRDLELLASSV